MQCTQRYLALSSKPTRVSRDGFAGPNANIYLPFYGYYFFDGSVRTFPGGGLIAQDRSRSMNGTHQPGGITGKSGCFCN